MKTWPEVEWWVAQSVFEKSCMRSLKREKRWPMDRWCDSSYMRTRRAAASSSGVGQLMALESIPTAYATSGRVCVEQYNRAPTSD
eukprot:1658599-Pleurochrysis_carterae.AAC.3